MAASVRELDSDTCMTGMMLCCARLCAHSTVAPLSCNTSSIQVTLSESVTNACSTSRV